MEHISDRQLRQFLAFSNDGFLSRSPAWHDRDVKLRSSGGLSPQQQIPLGPGYQVPFAERIRGETGLPTIAIGLITEPEQAEVIIAQGRGDMVALARAILYDPRWPWHAAAKLEATVDAPRQYWRSQPRGLLKLFGDAKIAQR